MKNRMLWFLSVAAGLLLMPLLPASTNPETRSLSIFFTGFVGGNFGPCGCAAGPSGGLARRAGYSQAYAAKSGDYILQVDLGNYFRPLGPHSKVVNELMTEGLRRMPIQVMNLAPDDLYFWDDLAQTKLPTQIISTNLKPRKNTRPAPPRYAIVTIAANALGSPRDLRIGFLGISDPNRVKPNSGFVGVEPLEAIAQVQEELQGRVDFVVVLADFDLGPGPFATDSLPARIARAHDNIYAVLVAEKRYLLRTPLQVNNAVLLSSVERGRHLGRLTFGLDQSGNIISARPEFTELSDKVPAEADLLRRQRELEAIVPPEL